jgi:dTDP-4-dehydrorhamnose reductase
MSVLLFGANGQVGWACIKEFKDRNVELTALGRKTADLSKPSAIKKIIKEHQPKLVINAAAYTAVDKAESEPEEAQAINAQAPAAMAEACSLLDIPLIHISTDYVFDGLKAQPYTEDDQPNPQSEYGRSKLAGEKGISATLNKHIILRTSWVFGIHGNNFVKTMLRLGQERDQLNIVADQHGGPTFAGHIAEVIFELSQSILTGKELAWGTYHLSGQPYTTWYGFACKIFEDASELGIITTKPQVNPISTEEFPTPAPRPKQSSLSCKSLEALTGKKMLPWKDGLNLMLSTLNRQNNNA